MWWKIRWDGGEKHFYREWHLSDSVMQWEDEIICWAVVAGQEMKITWNSCYVETQFINQFKHFIALLSHLGVSVLLDSLVPNSEVSIMHRAQVCVLLALLEYSTWQRNIIDPFKWNMNSKLKYVVIHLMIVNYVSSIIVIYVGYLVAFLQILRYR